MHFLDQLYKCKIIFIVDQHIFANISKNIICNVWYLKISYYFINNRQNSRLFRNNNFPKENRKNSQFFATYCQNINSPRSWYFLNAQFVFCINKLLLLQKSAKFVINSWNMNFFHGWYLLNARCFYANTLIHRFMFFRD